ncbi:hypothetical protein VNO77_18915 [Canavalia gladiata]|uniref:Uncharacterized protein n=1 Tax=Canavalia gladiata TaxID=3824 RepID=A0AAN9LLP5_CANGL
MKFEAILEWAKMCMSFGVNLVLHLVIQPIWEEEDGPSSSWSLKERGLDLKNKQEKKKEKRKLVSQGNSWIPIV